MRSKKQYYELVDCLYNSTSQMYPIICLILVVIIIVLISLTCYYASNSDNTPVKTYRLAGQRNSALCSPGDSDITLVMTPSIGDPETITVKDGETFVFAYPFQLGESYSIEQKGSVEGASCTLTNATGYFVSSDISNVVVSCETETLYTIGGTYTVDMDVTVTAVINPTLSSEESITLLLTSGTGTFVFAETYPSGTVYHISSDEDWTITDGTGVIQCANVTDIDAEYVSPP